MISILHFQETHKCFNENKSTNENSNIAYKGFPKNLKCHFLVSKRFKKNKKYNPKCGGVIKATQHPEMRR